MAGDKASVWLVADPAWVTSHSLTALSGFTGANAVTGGWALQLQSIVGKVVEGQREAQCSWSTTEKL